MGGKIIGYSGFDPGEECYEYFENSCYIADTTEGATELMKAGPMCMGGYRIDSITIDHIMNDYGCSCGDFAMEEAVFERFKVVADQKGIRYESHQELCDIPLMIVEVEGVKISDD